MDVKNAFLNGLLVEEISMMQPRVLPHPLRYVYKLRRALMDLNKFHELGLSTSPMLCLVLAEFHDSALFYSSSA